MKKDIVELLKKSSLFSSFDDELLLKISESVVLKNISKNELIFYESDPAAAFYLVTKGQVKVFKTSADGKEQILMIASKGDTFAEAALFGEGLYPASAQSLTDTEVLYFGKDKFFSLIEKNPKIALKLIARLSELLRKMSKLVEELSLADITTRLALFIVKRLEESGNKSEIELTEKKTILASQLGTIPETLSRSFNKLAREKIIEVEGPKIKILDSDKLHSIVGE